MKSWKNNRGDEVSSILLEYNFPDLSWRFGDPEAKKCEYVHKEMYQNFTIYYDICEDNEQIDKLQEIIDLLVTAGYFRARIKGLTAFDKVVGGMIWSMNNCSFDVNVDLLFQENSTIGQKIALTEKIVIVLPKMGCPHGIEPHQIQGLDFIHIFPVIQWLVKRSVKVREERKEFIRKHAVLNFDRLFILHEFKFHPIAENVKKIQDKYRRRRLFKRRSNSSTNEELDVENTLLEYGYPNMPLQDVVRSENKSSFSETTEFSDSISLTIMDNLMNLQAQKIAAVSQQFAKLKVDIESSRASFITKQKDMILQKKDALIEEETELEKEVEANLQTILVAKGALRKFDEGSQEINEKDQKVFEQLQSLILIETNFKRQEQMFREHCKTKLEKYQCLLKESCDRNKVQENSLADSQLQEERERVQAIKLQIAKKNRLIAFLQRQLDEIPGRGELAQYQRRFLELYNEVAQKHEETKQFYTMYNTLDDTKLYLSKELSLLNSVLDNYSEAMSNAIDKEEFMAQFEAIVSAIEQNKKKVERRRAEERSRRDKLSKQLLDLVEQQRNYVNIVKQLKIECKKNEELLAFFRKQV